MKFLRVSDTPAPRLCRSVRVKWCGKSAPAVRQLTAHGKPRLEQDQTLMQVIRFGEEVARFVQLQDDRLEEWHSLQRKLKNKIRCIECSFYKDLYPRNRVGVFLWKIFYFPPGDCLDSNTTLRYTEARSGGKWWKVALQFF